MVTKPLKSQWLKTQRLIVQSPPRRGAESSTPNHCSKTEGGAPGWSACQGAVTSYILGINLEATAFTSALMERPARGP